MEPLETVPLSALIAGMLLCNRDLSSANIVNMITKLNIEHIYVDDENDDLECLTLCVDIGSNYSFHLKNNMNYDTVLYDDVTVYNFLLKLTGQTVASFLGLEYIGVDSVMITNKKNERDKYGILTKILSRRKFRRSNLKDYNDLEKIIMQ